MHDLLIKDLKVGDSYTVQNFNGDVLDTFYVPANRMGMRISITQNNGTLTIRRIA